MGEKNLNTGHQDENPPSLEDSVSAAAFDSIEIPHGFIPDQTEMKEIKRLVFESNLIIRNEDYYSKTRETRFLYKHTDSDINAYAEKARVGPRIVLLGGLIREFARFACCFALQKEQSRLYEDILSLYFSSGPDRPTQTPQGRSRIEGLSSQAEEWASELLESMIMFVIAHEIGHVVYGHVFTRSLQNLPVEVSRNQERDADSFASSLIASSKFSREFRLLGQLAALFVCMLHELQTGRSSERGAHPLAGERLLHALINNEKAAGELGISRDMVKTLLMDLQSSEPDSGARRKLVNGLLDDLQLLFDSSSRKDETATARSPDFHEYLFSLIPGDNRAVPITIIASPLLRLGRGMPDGSTRTRKDGLNTHIVISRSSLYSAQQIDVCLENGMLNLDQSNHPITGRIDGREMDPVTMLTERVSVTFPDDEVSLETVIEFLPGADAEGRRWLAFRIKGDKLLERTCLWLPGPAAFTPYGLFDDAASTGELLADYDPDKASLELIIDGQTYELADGVEFKTGDIHWRIAEFACFHCRTSGRTAWGEPEYSCGKL